MSAAVKGKTIAEVRDLIRTFESMMSIHGSNLEGDGAGADGDGPPSAPAAEGGLGDLAALQGVVKFPVRIKCATLAWYTLREGLDESNVTKPE